MLLDTKIIPGDVIKIHDWYGIVQEMHFDANGDLSIIQVQTARNIFRGHGPEYIDVRMMLDAIRSATLADLEKEIKIHHQLQNSALDRMLSLTRSV